MDTSESTGEGMLRMHCMRVCAPVCLHATHGMHMSHAYVSIVCLLQSIISAALTIASHTATHHMRRMWHTWQHAMRVAHLVHRVRVRQAHERTQHVWHVWQHEMQQVRDADARLTVLMHAHACALCCMLHVMFVAHAVFMSLATCPSFSHTHCHTSSHDTSHA